jgi:Flp pilus assembly protein TadD
MQTLSIEAIAQAIGAGAYALAERQCRDGLADRPDDENLLLLLAISLQFQQRIGEAVDVYARLTELRPESSVHWGNYATALREAGAEQEAEQAYATAIRLDPRNPGPLLNLGLLLFRRKDFVAARETLLRAYELDRDSPVIRINAARACNACLNFEETDLLLKPWRSWLPLADEELQMELGSLQLVKGDGQAALELLEDLVRRAPANGQAKIYLVSAYERVNRITDAETLLARMMAPAAALPEAMHAEARRLQAKLALRKGDLAAARSILEALGPRDRGDFAHYFMLAEICDKQGETALAMRALGIAHARQDEELKAVLPNRYVPDAPALPAAVARVSVEAYRRWQPTVAPDAAQSPIFIVGFPRSGTTLLEQMLDAHPALQSMDENPFFNNLSEFLGEYGIRVPDDIPQFGQRDCDGLRQRYLTMVCETIPRRWDTRLVDKNPLNMLALPLIHRLFPRAKFILALRHPCDVILSCYMQNFRGVLATACSSLERLAVAYVAAMQSWLHHVEVFQPDVMVLRYEELVTDTAKQVRRIGDFLGLQDTAPLTAFDSHARNKGFIGTPSYTQVIQPVNRKGLNRWGRYRREFDPVLPLLEPMLRHWGYPDRPGD